MAKVEIRKVGDETYYGTVQMPHYQGVYGSTSRLTRDWEIHIELDDGTVVEISVKANFVFDGASIPRALWRVCGHPLETPRIAAALAHDWLYAAQVCKRDEADLIYRVILRAVGVAWWRRWTEWIALRAAGGVAWRSHSDGGAQELARKRGSLTFDGFPQPPKKEIMQ